MSFPTLSSFNIQPINTSLMPPQQDGWRKAMLVHYPDSGEANGYNKDWAVTTSLTRTITFMGITVKASSWNPNQMNSNVQAEFPEHRSFWVGEDDGFALDECPNIVKDYAYCYLHDSLTPPAGFTTCVLTIEQYKVQVLGAPIDTTDPAPIPEPIHAG